MSTVLDIPPLREYVLNAQGEQGIVLHPHKGQMDTLQSGARFIAMIAGTGGGKTSWGPHWLWNEMGLWCCQHCGGRYARDPEHDPITHCPVDGVKLVSGHGDWIVAAPSYKLMDKKCLPEFLEVFESYGRLGRYTHTDAIFTFNEEGMNFMHGADEETGEPFYDLDRPTKIFFGHADDPNSLESAMARGAWLDEAGQKRFRLESWEAIMRRVGLYQGRVLITTTPYDLGWLYRNFYLLWKAGDVDYDVINFPSTDNPMYSPLELERARRTLPDWKFKMFYLGIFTKPAGLIYDCFDDHNLIKPCQIPADWLRVIGLDFGGINFAAGFYAIPPDFYGLPVASPRRRIIKYREYYPRLQGLTCRDHVREMLKGENPSSRYLAVGGAPGESTWRTEFRAAGLKVLQPPIADVEVGIDRVYESLKLRQMKVFETMSYTIDQLNSYSREVDERGEVIAGTIEAKETYHLLDEMRYAVAYIKRHKTRWTSEDFKLIDPDLAGKAGRGGHEPNFYVSDEHYRKHVEETQAAGYDARPKTDDLY